MNEIIDFFFHIKSFARRENISSLLFSDISSAFEFSPGGPLTADVRIRLECHEGYVGQRKNVSEGHS